MVLSAQGLHVKLCFYKSEFSDALEVLF
jgi:hypothetical protein